MAPSRPSDEAEVFDFLDEYHRDAGAGKTPELAHYLRRFPGHEEAIAREFLRLRRAVIDDAAAPDAATPRDDKRIGPYKLIRELGAGGQGAVWLAEDTRIARRVALKFLPSSFALLSADRRRRFQREAEVVSRLEHPSICPVYEAQIDHDPPYIAMRLVEGETLASAISRARAVASATAAGATSADASVSQTATPTATAASLPLPPRNAVELRRVLSFFERAARTLHAAHEAGVIHRDVKPGNVMVSKNGEPMLLDFGQARDEHAALGEQTLSGEVFGTPAYMSPEQVLGSAHALDRRTDVWSLGATLFEALTLVRPFQGASVTALLHSIRTNPLPKARERNPALEEDVAVVLETALEKDSARRYASALDFAEDLRRVREYEPIRARPASAGLKLRRWARRHPALATSIAGVIVALTTGLAWTLYMLRREHTLSQEKDLALDHALGWRLAERTIDLLDEDPSAALAVALHAVELAPNNYQTRSALMSALDACQLATVFNGDLARLVLDVDLADDSRRLVLGLDDSAAPATAPVWDLRAGKELARATGFPGPVAAVRFARGDERFVALSTDRVLRVFDSASGALSSELDGPTDALVAIDVDADGEQLVALGRDGAVALYDLASDTRRVVFALEPEHFGCVEFSADGQRLLFSSSRLERSTSLYCERAVICDARDGRVLGALGEAGATLAWAEFAPDGARVVTASRSGVVSVWRVPSCERDGASLELGVPATCARFTPDGSALVIGTAATEHSSVLVWELATGARRELELRVRDRIVSIDVSGDGRIVATSSDTSVRTWEADGRRLEEFGAWMSPIATRWTADGQRLVTFGMSGFVRVSWGENRPDVYALRGHDGPVTQAGFDSAGSRALTLSKDGSARLWHTPRTAEERGEREPGAQIARLGSGASPVECALFTHDGARAVTLEHDGCVVSWDARDGAQVGEFRVDGVPRAAEIGPDGQRLLITTAGGRVEVCSLDRGAALALDARAACASWSPDGALVAVGGTDNALRVYDARTGALVREHAWKPERVEPGVVALDFRTDGAQVAVACADWRVRFFAPFDDGVARTRLSVFKMTSVAFNAPGTHLLAIGALGRGAVRLYDLVADKAVKGESFHSDYLTSGAFDRSGRYVVTTSEDATAFVREAASGEPVLRLAGHAGAVLCAQFSRDDGALRIITGSADGTARVWPLDPVAPAKLRKPRELIEDEVAREKRLAAPLPYR